MSEDWNSMQVSHMGGTDLILELGPRMLIIRKLDQECSSKDSNQVPQFGIWAPQAVSYCAKLPPLNKHILGAFVAIRHL